MSPIKPEKKKKLEIVGKRGILKAAKPGSWSLDTLACHLQHITKRQ